MSSAVFLGSCYLCGSLRGGIGPQGGVECERRPFCNNSLSPFGTCSAAASQSRLASPRLPALYFCPCPSRIINHHLRSLPSNLFLCHNVTHKSSTTRTKTSRPLQVQQTHCKALYHLLHQDPPSISLTQTLSQHNTHPCPLKIIHTWNHGTVAIPIRARKSILTTLHGPCTPWIGVRLLLKKAVFA